MIRYQTTLYRAVRVKQFGWDYGQKLFESNKHAVAAAAMGEFEAFLKRGKWIATMICYKGSRVIDEQIFDSSAFSEF